MRLIKHSPLLQDEAVEELARAHTRTISLAPTKHTTMTYFSHTSFYDAYYLRFYKLIPKTVIELYLGLCQQIYGFCLKCFNDSFLISQLYCIKAF